MFALVRTLSDDDRGKNMRAHSRDAQTLEGREDRRFERAGRYVSGQARVGKRFPGKSLSAEMGMLSLEFRALTNCCASGLQTSASYSIRAYMNRASSTLGLGTLLRRLIAELDGDVQAHYNRLGIPFRPRFHPLFQHLLRHGSATIGDIAIAIHATQPAATQTVNELKGLHVVTVDAGADRRERRVQLSAEGLRMAEELTPLWQAIERAAAGLDEELSSGLRTTLEGALAALERCRFEERIDDELSKTED